MEKTMLHASISIKWLRISVKISFCSLVSVYSALRIEGIVYDNYDKLADDLERVSNTTGEKKLRIDINGEENDLFN